MICDWCGRFTPIKSGDSRTVCQICGRVTHCSDCTKLRAELEELKELNTMQLTGILTAVMQNTVDSSKERIAAGNPYWTVAYGEVCRAVDREIKLRAELERAEKVIELGAILNLAIRLHKSPESIIMANRYLGEGIREYFAEKEKES
mgnify:FL=1